MARRNYQSPPNTGGPSPLDANHPAVAEARALRDTLQDKPGTKPARVIDQRGKDDAKPVKTFAAQSANVPSERQQELIDAQKERHADAVERAREARTPKHLK